MPTKRKATDTLPDKESLNEARRAFSLPFVVDEKDEDSMFDSWPEELKDCVVKLRKEESWCYSVFASIVEDSSAVLEQLKQDNIVEEKRAYFEQGLNELTAMKTKYASTLKKLCFDVDSFLYSYGKSFDRIHREIESMDTKKDTKKRPFLKKRPTER